MDYQMTYACTYIECSEYDECQKFMAYVLLCWWKFDLTVELPVYLANVGTEVASRLRRPAMTPKWGWICTNKSIHLRTFFSNLEEPTKYFTFSWKSHETAKVHFPMETIPRLDFQLCTRKPAHRGVAQPPPYDISINGRFSPREQINKR